MFYIKVEDKQNLNLNQFTIRKQTFMTFVHIHYVAHNTRFYGT